MQNECDVMFASWASRQMRQDSKDFKAWALLEPRNLQPLGLRRCNEKKSDVRLHIFCTTKHVYLRSI